MRMFSLLTITLCTLLTVSPALAKDKKTGKQMDQQAMMELWQKLAQPGEPHKLFADIAGSYTTHTKEWMEPGKPPMEADGTSESKMLLDGRFLYQEYHGSMMGQPFHGIGIDGYDNMTKKYVTAWIDSMGTGIFIMEGTATADELPKLTGRFGMIVEHDPKQAIDITHNLRTAIIDPQGTLVKTYTGNEWTPDQVLSDLGTRAAVD